MLNDRVHYFGQTVNIAARVQGRAESNSILATQAVVGNSMAGERLAAAGLTPVPHQATLGGITDQNTVYEIT